MKRPIPKIDELNLLDYEYADKIIAYLNQHLYRLMGAWVSSFLHFKPADRMKHIEDTFEEWDDLVYSFLHRVSVAAYKQTVRASSCPIDKRWVKTWSKKYNDVTKYVFADELDRKESRCETAVAQTENLQQTVKEQMKAFAGQMNQAVEDIVKDASIQALKDAGVKYVKWWSVGDEKRCEECRDLHGQIFPIDKIPSKPHRRCRCQLLPVKEGKK